LEYRYWYQWPIEYWQLAKYWFKNFDNIGIGFEKMISLVSGMISVVSVLVSVLSYITLLQKQLHKINVNFVAKLN